MVLNFLIVFALGLALGSFLNVLIWRLNSEDGTVPRFWQGRSLCPRCRHGLSWSDNIPLLSFFLLSGRCRYCRKKISWQYPLVELLTALFTVATWFCFPDLSPIAKLLYCSIAYTLIVIFFSDWIYGLIPDEMIIAGSVAAVIYGFQFSVFSLGTHLLSGVVSGLAFLLIVVVTRFRGMGLGDVKLAFLLGFLLGWPKVAVAFWWSFVLGGFSAVVLVLLKKVRLSDKMAFGPYLIAGAIFSVLWSRDFLRLLGF